jgi:hypothetical protein
MNFTFQSLEQKMSTLEALTYLSYRRHDCCDARWGEIAMYPWNWEENAEKKTVNLHGIIVWSHLRVVGLSGQSLLIIRLEDVMVNTFWYVLLYVFVRLVLVAFVRPLPRSPAIARVTFLFCDRSVSIGLGNVSWQLVSAPDSCPTYIYTSFFYLDRSIWYQAANRRRKICWWGGGVLLAVIFNKGCSALANIIGGRSRQRWCARVWRRTPWHTFYWHGASAMPNQTTSRRRLEQMYAIVYME